MTSWPLGRIISVILIWGLHDFHAIASTLTLAASICYFMFETTIMEELSNNDNINKDRSVKELKLGLKKAFADKSFYVNTLALMLAWFAKGFSYHNYSSYASCVPLAHQTLLKAVLKVPQCLIAMFIIHKTRHKVIPVSMLQFASTACYFCLMQYVDGDPCSWITIGLINLAHSFDCTTKALLWIMTMELAPFNSAR